MHERNFALIGLAGYVAPRHLRAIRDTGNRLVAAVDPHDSVGVVDGYFPDARFFTEIERFDRHLEKLRRMSAADRVEYVSVCSPNYLHDAHIRFALRLGAHAICEKPLVINPWNLDALEALEREHEARVYTVLQLRYHPALIALRQRLEAAGGHDRADVVLTYVTRRGAWYDTSWKGSEEKSGGLVMNIGIHFFDLLMWLFGPSHRTEVHARDSTRVAGVVELERASVRWYLSVDEDDLPAASRERGEHAYRALTMDGEDIDFSTGFQDLHTAVYKEALAGRGFGIADARPSIQMVYDIRHAPVVEPTSARHPLLDKEPAATVGEGA